MSKALDGIRVIDMTREFDTETGRGTNPLRVSRQLRVSAMISVEAAEPGPTQRTAR